MKSAGGRVPINGARSQAHRSELGVPFRVLPSLCHHLTQRLTNSSSPVADRQGWSVPLQAATIRKLSPRLIRAQIVRAMRFASAMATTFTGFLARIRSSQPDPSILGTVRRPRRALGPVGIQRPLMRALAA